MTVFYNLSYFYSETLIFYYTLFLEKFFAFSSVISHNIPVPSQVLSLFAVAVCVCVCVRERVLSLTVCKQ
jgi:hypothetical protein